MNESRGDALSAVVARQRGRARLRVATIALGTAGLIGAGAVAATLPGVTHQGSSGTSTVAVAGKGAATHATSGGSGAVAAASSGQAGQATAPAAASRAASHAVSAGS